ncbi:MAG: hypothetical protein AAF900_01085, partial [Bacteroidota bacterium]
MNTPLFIAFIVFLFVNLALGLYKGRNVKTMKDYALANRAMGTGTLMITIVATMIGSNYATNGFTSAQNHGIIGLMIMGLGYAIGSLLLGRIV